MVRNRVATAARIPVIQVVMLPMTVGRSFTASGVDAGSAANAAAPSSITNAAAVNPAVASRYRLRYMMGHTSRPRAWGVSGSDGRRHRGRGRAVGAVLLRGPQVQGVNRPT